MRFPRGVRILVILALCVGVCGGIAPATLLRSAAAQDEPVKGGVLHLALGEEPDQLDPARTISLTSSQVMEGVYDRLVYIDDKGLPQPSIAESWTVSPDGKTITFKIRQGIKFQDGTTLDAPAVKFNYDRILDPKMAAPYKTFVGTLTSVDAPDATTAVFHFSAPYAPFFTNSTIIGIASPTAIKKYGDNFGHH